MHGDCSIKEFTSLLAERSNDVTKKHHAVKSNPYIDMIGNVAAISGILGKKECTRMTNGKGTVFMFTAAVNLD